MEGQVWKPRSGGRAAISPPPLKMVARFHISQCRATVDPVDEPFVPKPEPEVQKKLPHAEIIGRIVGKIGQGGPAEEVCPQAADAAESAARA